MTDPRRIAAHLAQELAAVGAPVPAHDDRFDGRRLVTVCDVPEIATFGTDGSRIWWQVRGRAHRHQTDVNEDGPVRARDALVQAVYAKQASSGPMARGHAGDAGAAAGALAEDLARLLPRGRVAVADDDPWPTTIRVRTGDAAASVQVAGGWYTWPDPASDFMWHLVGLRRCLHTYRHIASARLLTLLRSQQAHGGPVFPAGRPPDRPGAAA